MLFVHVLNIGLFQFSLIIRPLFPSFLHHHCLQILYATNFLIENVFYLLVSLIFVHTRLLVSASDPFAAASPQCGNSPRVQNDDHSYIHLGLVETKKEESLLQHGSLINS